MAAGAITKETKLLFLDAIFHLAPPAINLVVESLRATFQIGQNITRISASEGVFGFRNDPSFPVPTLSLILKLSEEPHFFSVPLVVATVSTESHKKSALGSTIDFITSRTVVMGAYCTVGVAGLHPLIMNSRLATNRVTRIRIPLHDAKGYHRFVGCSDCSEHHQNLFHRQLSWQRLSELDPRLVHTANEFRKGSLLVLVATS